MRKFLVILAMAFGGLVLVTGLMLGVITDDVRKNDTWVCVDRLEEGEWAVLEIAGEGELEVIGYVDMPISEFRDLKGTKPEVGRQYLIPNEALEGRIR